MNGFTLENTKDATHVINGEFKKISGNGKQAFLSVVSGYTWQESFFNREHLLNSKNLTTLSRPHNETHEYWTNFGVTQYAQGNNMIHIDFSRNITPFVMGDKLYNAEAKRHFVIDDKDQLAAFNNHNEKDKDKYFVVSFAERPNTGKQPVGDDIMVNIKNEPTAYRADSPLIVWESPEFDASWKPNHSAMLKQWQAGQLEKGVHIDTDGDLAVGSEKVGVADQVKNPSHYQLMTGVESIEIIARSMTAEQWHGYCLGNIIKYRLRAGKKDKMEQDIAKADFYSELFDMHKDKCIIKANPSA